MDPTVAMMQQLISAVGFPIFVAVWLLWRTDKLLASLTAAIEKMGGTVAECPLLKAQEQQHSDTGKVS